MKTEISHRAKIGQNDHSNPYIKSVLLYFLIFWLPVLLGLLALLIIYNLYDTLQDDCTGK